MHQSCPVVCEQRTYSRTPNSHRHAFAQLILPVDASLSISLNQGAFEEAANEVVYVPPLCDHAFFSAEPNRFLVFDIPAPLFPGKTGFKTKYTLDQRWEAIRSLLLCETEEGRPASGHRISALWAYVIGMLKPEPDFASLDYIHQYYAAKLSLRQLADIEHYNQSYYCEWFRKKTGHSPMDYIRTLRLQRAKSLLTDSEFSVMRIAQEVGYDNQSTLTKVFKKYLGVSPAEFRRLAQNRTNMCRRPAKY